MPQSIHNFIILYRGHMSLSDSFLSESLRVLPRVLQQCLLRALSGWHIRPKCHSAVKHILNIFFYLSTKVFLKIIMSLYKTAVLGIGKLSFFCSKLRIPRQGQCKKNHRSPSTVLETSCLAMMTINIASGGGWWTHDSPLGIGIFHALIQETVYICSAVYNLRAER